MVLKGLTLKDGLCSMCYEESVENKEQSGSATAKINCKLNNTNNCKIKKVVLYDRNGNEAGYCDRDGNLTLTPATPEMNLLKKVRDMIDDAIKENEK